MEGTSDRDFQPPGPGTWLCDTTHFTRPATPLYAEIWPQPAIEGCREAARRYGLLLDHFAIAHVEQIIYLSRRPIAALTASDVTTAAGFRAATASDAEFNERAAAAEKALRARSWREDLDRWDRMDKPALVAGHRRLLAVDPFGLLPNDLAGHLADCREHLRRGVHAHHRYTIPSLLPLGDLMAHVEDWTGRPGGVVLRLLRGTSNVSLGATKELDRAATAIVADPSARTILASTENATECLERLRRLPGPTRAAVTAYLDIVGFRSVNGHDIGEPYAFEVPEVLVQALHEATTRAGDGPEGDDQDNTMADLRHRIPRGHRSSFSALLDEARHINRLRDERDLLADGTAEGITRRAVLAAGATLVRTGAIRDPADLIQADFAEISALLAGDNAAPSADTLVRRVEAAERLRPSDAPPTLGPPPAGPIPLEWLPPAMARVERAVRLGISSVFGDSPPPRSDRVRGTGTGGGIVTGPARVVRGTGDFSRLRAGDILVAPSTSPAFNVVLPLLTAVVTDWGGLLSHAAIVAREAGIPAVVGCADATSRIPDGAMIQIDADTGDVTLLDSRTG